MRLHLGPLGRYGIEGDLAVRIWLTVLHKGDFAAWITLPWLFCAIDAQLEKTLNRSQDSRRVAPD